MTTEQTREVLRLICAAYPTQRQKLRPQDLHAMLEIWSVALADIDIDTAKAAAGRIVMTSKWLPSISEFRAECGTVQNGGDSGRSGLDAWGDIKAMRAYRGREALADFDPIVVKVCIAFDWIVWRTLWRNGEDIEQWHVETGDNEESDRIRFAQLYERTQADDRRQGQLTPGAKIPQRIAAPGGKTLGAIVQGMLPSGTGDS